MKCFRHTLNGCAVNGNNTLEIYIHRATKINLENTVLGEKSENKNAMTKLMLCEFKWP